MKAIDITAAVVLAVSAGGALAETGVRVADIGFVSNVYGRGGIPAVRTAGPLMMRAVDVNIAGRNSARGAGEGMVKAENADVAAVAGRT